MRGGSLEISTYHPASADDPAPCHNAAPPRRYLPRALVSVLAGTVAVALHAILVASIIWGAGAAKRQTDPRTPGAWDTSVPDSADDGAMQLTLIDQPSDAPSSAEQQEGSKSLIASLSPIQPLALPADLGLELPPIVSDDSSNAPASTADSATRSAMYGRYLGQINARIDRAWLRPRSAIGAPTFFCRVRIDQDGHGNVQDVTLEDCNGDKRWQLSLVQAIESASPLPAPPDPSVFTRIVHASFVAPPYGPGVQQALYEPEFLAQQAALAAQPQVNEKALSDFGEALDKSHSGKAISLTLSGTAESQHRSSVPPSGVEGPSPQPPAAPPP